MMQYTVHRIASTCIKSCMCKLLIQILGVGL